MRPTHFALAAISLVALAAITGCAPQQATPPAESAPSADSTSALSGEWRLTSGADATGSFELADSVVTLTLLGQTTGGKTPCNVFGATVTVPEATSSTGTGAIDITPTFQTKAACADQKLMELEPRYLAALDAVTEAATSADSLVLTDTNAKVRLEFERIAEVPTAALVGTEWLLESLITGGDNGSISSVMGDGTLTLANDGTLAGFTGCNNFAGSWNNDGGVLRVTDLALDERACSDDLMSQQQHIVDVLRNGFTPTIDGGTLTITAADGGNAVTYRSAALSES
ncbi:MAG: META domain-containing protein [Microbacteriaceae bacterium]